MDHFPVITGQLSGFGADIYLETMDRCPITHRIHFHERIARYFWPGDSGWQYTNMWKYKRIFSDCIPGNGRTSKYFRKVIHWKPIQIYLEVAGQSGYSWKVIRIFFYSEFLIRKTNKNTSLAATGALAHRLQRRTPAKSKMAARGPQNGRGGLERCLLLGFWAFPSTFAK